MCSSLEYEESIFEFSQKYTNEIMECFSIFILLMHIYRDYVKNKDKKNVNPGPENKLD